MDRTNPSKETRAAEREEAKAAHEPDDMPTSDDEAAAARAPELDPEAAEHYKEMAERGAHQKGEGRIP